MIIRNKADLDMIIDILEVADAANADLLTRPHDPDYDYARRLSELCDHLREQAARL